MHLSPRIGLLSFRRIAGILAVALFLANSQHGNAAEAEFEPLATGMEWIMSLQFTSKEGTITNGIYHRKIGESVKHNGKTYFRSHTWLEESRPFVMDYTKLVRKDAEGYYSIDERDPRRFEKRSVKFPFEVGKSWDVKTDTGSTNRTSVIVKEDVTIGTNSYLGCFRLQILSLSGNYREEFLEAPGVGAIKSEIKPGDGSKWLLTLKEFKKP
jgi:hypothetical protein